MKIINLRLHYPHCQQDKLVEVSEEVFDVLCQSVREMRNYERRKRYHRAFYSLDAFDWTENYVLEHSPSPEQLIMLVEEQAERDRLAAALREALTYATPTQARRIRAYYLGGLTQQQIADRECVHNSKRDWARKKRAAGEGNHRDPKPQPEQGAQRLLQCQCPAGGPGIAHPR